MKEILVLITKQLEALTAESHRQSRKQLRATENRTEKREIYEQVEEMAIRMNQIADLVKKLN